MSSEDLAATKSKALQTTLRRHLAVLPLWSLRVLASGFEGGSFGPWLIALDALIAILHWRANRLSDLADPMHFGTKRSWTRLLYIPELLALSFVAYDGFTAYILYQRAHTHWF
jgi:hypothetical protein